MKSQIGQIEITSSIGEILTIDKTQEEYMLKPGSQNIGGPFDVLVYSINGNQVYKQKKNGSCFHHTLLSEKISSITNNEFKKHE